MNSQPSRGAANKAYKLGVVSSYVPKKCGVATFTNNLLSNLLQLEPKTDLWIAAAEDNEDHEYSPAVKTVIDVGSRASYQNAAKLLAKYSPDVILLQHEYGLYGGDWSDYEANGVQHHDRTGNYLLDLIRPQSKPIITTLHTVLKDLDPARKTTLGKIIGRSSRVVVMSELSKKIITGQFPTAKSKVVVIPHGVMVREKPEAKATTLKRLKLPAGKFYLTVTGLMSPNKKIETIISALPKIIAKHPEVHLLVVGQTHPDILKQSGDWYHDDLKELAAKLGVTAHVSFVNEYMPAAKLLDYLAVTDVYLTIHSDPEQAVSGTLANAIGNGLVAVSTPYSYAREVLAKNRGLLVPFDSPTAIAGAINRLIEDKTLYKEIRRNAAAYGNGMAWINVAQAYGDLVESVLDEQP